MAVKKKGLDSLIPDNKPAKKNTETVQKAEEKKEEMKDGVQMMKISMIEPNREQPRKKFEEDALLELADSIKLHGVLQPLLVRKIKDYYEIIAGERRWRAAKLAGIKLSRPFPRPFFLTAISHSPPALFSVLFFFHHLIRQAHITVCTCRFWIIFVNRHTITRCFCQSNIARNNCFIYCLI